MLRVKLRHLDEWNRRRSDTASRYLDGLGEVAGEDLRAELILPHVPDWAEPIWHLFVISHPRRDALQKQLAEAGIGTLIHYPIPPHLSQAYSDLDLPQDSLPLAEQIASRVLSLPIGPHMEQAQTEKVISAVEAL